MKLKTQKQPANAVQSRYETMSIAEQGESLHQAAREGTLDKFAPADWDVFIGQGDGGKNALGYKDSWQRLFLHIAASHGHLNQIPHYLFNHMTAERGYDAELWLSKDSAGDNILDNAAYWDNGARFPKAMIPALWRGRQAVLTTLWAEMQDKHKDRDGVQEAYQKFLLHPMLRVPKKGLVLK